MGNPGEGIPGKSNGVNINLVVGKHKTYFWIGEQLNLGTTEKSSGG